ncbi:LysR family transcriptional regulator [Parashewanella tropica]|uniref:LysR family transcriptional regulator n=1 Tax=Parashewanella tropica TaxID=2547970 RepID=UPI001059F313|nr:LysR family transcriptional regulator [Parashewanella tropica]
MALSSQLLLFLDVVQQGSFTKAAALHDMDRSSLSKKIKQLEADLGVRLLNRSTRSFSLTPAGDEVLATTLKLKDNLNEIKYIASSYQSEPKGRLRITSPNYFGHLYLSPVITDFIRTYPDIEIEHCLSDIKSDIISDNFDLAFRFGKLVDSRLIAKKIADVNYVLVASQSFVERYGLPLTPEELESLPSVVYKNSDITLDQLTLIHKGNSEKNKNIRLQGRYKVSDIRTLINSVVDGLGYSFFDASILDKPISESGLVTLLPQYKVANKEAGIYALYPHIKSSMLARRFLQAVEEHIGTPPRWLSNLE